MTEQWRYEDLGPYARRIVRRHGLWWAPGRRWWSLRWWRDALHRRRERSIVRAEADPAEAWRCCEHWQRTLVNKRLSRVFAAAHGVRVPELYWRGPRTDAPLESLPRRFVIRPERGAARRGVHVVRDGIDLLRGEPATVEALRARLARDEAEARRVPILVEALVPAEGDAARLPFEYKCQTFAGEVVAIEHFARSSIRAYRHRYYTPGWRSFEPPTDPGIAPAEQVDPPWFLGEMLDAASRLGRALGTYMRIDFFGSDRGCVFNEFSSTPDYRNLSVSRTTDELFEAAWRRNCPESV